MHTSHEGSEPSVDSFFFYSFSVPNPQVIALLKTKNLKMHTKIKPP